MAYKGKRINPQKFERGQIKIIAILLPLVIFMALPIVFIANHAFKPMDELFAFPPTFFVRNATLENFTKLIKFSRTAGVPRYLVICKVGLIDSIWAHILPLLAYPVALFLVKQFVEQVPDSLIEAAYIDGATDWTVYRKIIIPMIKPAIATAAILVFQQVWVNMETSNYYVNDDSMKTLTFYMNSLVNVNNTVSGQGMAAAASLILFVPNLVLFIILQNNVMNTMAHSGIK